MKVRVHLRDDGAQLRRHARSVPPGVVDIEKLLTGLMECGLEVVAHNIARSVETGDGRAGFGSGDFYAELRPQVRLRSPSRWLHLGKVLYVQYWFHRWF